MPDTDPPPYKQVPITGPDEAPERVSEVAEKVRAKAEAARGAAVRGLESAASTIRDKAIRLPGERMTQMARATADKLSATADYMKAHEMKDMVADVEKIIRRKHGQSLLAAAVVGFLAGRAFRRH